MFCYQCKNKAEFQCCSGSYCGVHFNQHCKKLMKHQPIPLTFQLDQSQTSILNQNLNNLIETLKRIKTQAIIYTEQIMKTITDIHNSTLKEINSLIKHFNDLKNSREFSNSCIDEVNKIINNYMDYELKMSHESLEEFSKFYFMELIEEDLKISIQRENIQKKFLETHNGGFRCGLLASDRMKLVTGSEDSTVRVWDLAAGKQVACLTGHKSDVLCLASVNDFSLVVSGSSDRSLIFWDMINFKIKKVLCGHSGKGC